VLISGFSFVVGDAEDAGDVLPYGVAEASRRETVDNPDVVAEESRLPVEETGPLAGDAEALAGRPAGEDVDRLHLVGVELGDVVVDHGVREPLPEHALGRLVDLAYPGDLVAETLPRELEAADP
jgi:hypothetical protein